MNPEERARQSIDAQLQQCGWVQQDYRASNLSAAHGIADGEVPLDSGGVYRFHR